MDRYGAFEEHRPVTWVRGHPVYAAHLLVVVFVASLFMTSLAMALNLRQVFLWLPFSSEAVLRGQAWRVLTYGLVNPPDIWFLIDMAMIIWFGREVERFLGCRKFLTLFACLYLLTPILLTVLGIWRPSSLAGQRGAFALFVAFATLYPNAVLFFNVLAKWAAMALVGFYTLIALSNRDSVGLASLWSTVGFAFAFVRYEQGRWVLPTFRMPRRRSKLRVVPDPKPRRRESPLVSHDSAMAEIDQLLDKIARSGIESLTSKERVKLNTARERLMKRQSGG